MVVRVGSFTEFTLTRSVNVHTPKPEGTQSPDHWTPESGMGSTAESTLPSQRRNLLACHVADSQDSQYVACLAHVHCTEIYFFKVKTIIGILETNAHPRPPSIYPMTYIDGDDHCGLLPMTGPIYHISSVYPSPLERVSSAKTTAEGYPSMFTLPKCLQ